MLRKFIDWWNKKPWVEEVDFQQQNDRHYEKTEEEYKYETTLARDLKMIADLLGKEFPKHIAKIHIQREKRIEFRSEGYSVQDIKKEVSLESFHVENDHSSIRVVYWSATVNEYERVYKSKYVQYGNIIRELLSLVKDNFNNPDYFYVFCKYEDSIYIVASTLKDEHENNGREISEDLFQKAKIIVEKCGRAIMKRHRELEHIEELQKEAVSKSLIGRLDSEIEYMDKFVEVDMSAYRVQEKEVTV